MRTIVIRSNHGNHRGYDRTWEVLNGGDCFGSIEEGLRYLAGIADNRRPKFNPDNGNTIPRTALSSWADDLYYYYVITQQDYDEGWFCGGHRGYANAKIKAIFL